MSLLQFMVSLIVCSDCLGQGRSPLTLIVSDKPTPASLPHQASLRQLCKWGLSENRSASLIMRVT